jgi:hypothetical protein
MENSQPQASNTVPSIGTLHLTVWALVGVAIAIVVTYPLAMWRVSQMEKFKGFHVIGVNERYEPIPKPLISKTVKN